MASDPTLRVAVVGSGSVARRHVQNLACLGVEVVVCTSTTARAREVEREWQVEATDDLVLALAGCRGVVVATPTDRHIAPALAAARAGCGIFIEKPLSHTLEGIGELSAAVAEAAVAVEVGCNLRNHPGLRFMKETVANSHYGDPFTFRAVAGLRLDYWRPGTDHRQSYSAAPERGGGVLFDLVHEIDLVHWMFGGIAGVNASLDRRGNLGIRSEDLANLILRTRGGVVGQVQLDYLSAALRRSFEVVCEKASLFFSLKAGRLWREDHYGTETLFEVSPTYAWNDMYMDHMRHFLARLDDAERRPICSLADGIAAMTVLVGARRSDAARGERVVIPE